MRCRIGARANQTCRFEAVFVLVQYGSHGCLPAKRLVLNIANALCERVASEPHSFQAPQGASKMRNCPYLQLHLGGFDCKVSCGMTLRALVVYHELFAGTHTLHFYVPLYLSLRHKGRQQRGAAEARRAHNRRRREVE